ncbi:MAG: hypothetical protein A2Z21_02200 [Candidatus Fraserbacteria bacterium RBG_16_55_9]|uniref:Helicase HerA central domain-containing protein n=1 Tax=Fraserbacteria sp. (strain RBG_16_55_9) TaxID=1817864 RepID=A0A1F5V1N8_FRAXR|nr:MAG: hypothetical protein A2Z21_02200 [Candidatus Fraserbacteria bacterium RBG_16_55_9]
MAKNEEFDLERELQQLQLSSEHSRPPTVGNTPAGLKPLKPEEIGRVAISEELFISTTENCIEIYVPEERRNDVAVGQYVVIPLGYRDEKLFSYIKRLSYRKRDAIDDMSEVHVLLSAESIGEDEYIQLAELEPISMISAEGLPVEVRYLPKPNALVRRVTSKDEVVLGLDLPEDGLFLGYVSVNGEPITLSSGLKIPYYLNNDVKKAGDPLIFTHILIAGMSGRGKTHTAKNFLRQIVGSEYTLERRGGECRKPCLVIIDPENEYWGLRDDNPSGVPREELDNLVGVGGKLGGIGKKLTVFSGVEAGCSYRGCDAHTDFMIPFELVSDFPYLIAGGELNEAQYTALERLIRDFFKSSPDKTYQAFRRFLEDEEKMQTYLATDVIHEATLGAIRRRVLLPQFSHIFDQGANSITKLYESIFAEDQVSVFPTNHLSAEGERVVVLAVMSLIADAKTKAIETEWGRRISRFPVILAVDEAHNYLTQAQTQQDRIIVEKFVMAAKQGRKNRLGLVLITQNPQDVSEAVLSQISTRILLGMEQGMAERAGAPKQYQKALPYFERGRMIVHSPDNSRPLEIRGLHFCVVKH